MADILGIGNGPAEPLRVVVGAATREMRTALFVVTRSADIRIVATASSMAELVTHTRTFQPDAVIVADDLVPSADRVRRIASLREILRRGKIIVVGPSVAETPAAAGITTVEDVAGLLNELFRADAAPFRRRVG
jgi:hypothetical protein